MPRLSAYAVFLVLSAASPLLQSTIWVVGAVYYVLSAHMGPLQLVLVGTALEMSYFVFQAPTGAFADTHGRRTSVVIGVCLAGLCWIAQGLVPVFAAIAAAEIVRGLAEAFVDGAADAWLADELGEERFNRAVIRGSQVGQIGGAAGTLAGVALASIRLNLPIVVGGAAIVLLGLFLAAAMPEEGFQPTPSQGLSRRTILASTIRTGLQTVRSHPLLPSILALTLFFGLSSEGFDRLWQAHLLNDFTLPALGRFKPLVWFGILNLAVTAIQVPSAQALHRLNPQNTRTLLTALLAVDALLVAGVIGFALSHLFGLAVALFLLARAMRQTAAPLYTALLNANISNPSIRATVLSLGGQVDALGQVVGGPLVGVVGTAVSLRAALLASGILLSPTLAIITGMRGESGAWKRRLPDSPRL